MLFLEVVMLLHVRKYLPGGIAPVLYYKTTPDFINDLGSGDWVDYDPASVSIIRSTIESDLGDLGSYDRPDAIVLIRDWTRMQTDEMNVEIVVRDPAEILDELKNGGSANCEPLAILYLAALEAYDIPARRVDTFGEAGNFHKAHTTVEVWDGSGWILQDPTFNTVAREPGGKLLGISEIQRNLQSGIPFDWLQNATQFEPSMENYYIPPDELYSIVFYRMHGYPTDVSRWVQRFQKFFARLTGRIDSVIVSEHGFPVPTYMMNGWGDRVILTLALIFAIMAILPGRKYAGNR